MVPMVMMMSAEGLRQVLGAGKLSGLRGLAEHGRKLR